MPVRVPRTADEPRTLVEMFQRAAKQPQAAVLNYKQNDVWQAISLEHFIERAEKIALGLYALGLRRGDRTAILAANCLSWSLADAGSLFAGLIDVPIYTTQAAEQVRYILDDSGARVLFIQHAAAYERVKEQLAGCATLEHIVFFEGEVNQESTSHPAMTTAMTLAQLEERGNMLRRESPTLAAQLAGAVLPDDLATIIYTSGTTGEPKGVMLTHTNLITNLIDSSTHLTFNEQDTALSLLPLSHILERLAMYMYLYLGMQVYYAESLEKMSDNLREVRPTLMIGVPRLFEKIYARVADKAVAGGKAKTAIFNWSIETAKEWARLSLTHQKIPALLSLKHKLATRLVFAKWREAMGGRLRLFVSGGAALPEELGYIYAGAGMPITQGYGLTETSPVIAACSPTDNIIGTVGRPINNVEVRIAADGEIEVRGPNVMRGYFNKPEATRAAFTEDGWFKTGDVGALDEAGYLRITDRKKELFKTSGGKYIAPQFIEQRIKTSRFVSQVVLIGEGRRFPAALIVPDWNQLRSYAELKGLTARTPAEFVREPRIVDLFERQVKRLMEDLAQYERVKKIALLENELTIEGGELTPTLKLKRRVIQDKYRAVIDRLYEEASHSASE